MSKFKVGDRVSVAAFESDVEYVSSNGTLVDVGYQGEYYTLPASLLTKIAEPLKVGDVITLGVGAEPPHQTTCVFASGEIIQNWQGRWHFASPGGISPKWDGLSQSDVTIVYLP